MGDPPALVAEATAELGHSETGFARIFAAYPAHQTAPRMVVDRADDSFGRPVSEVVWTTPQVSGSS